MGRRWSRSSKVLAALAVVLAAAAYLLVRTYAERVEALAPALGEPATVLIAVRDVERGAVLEPSMLRAETMPSAFAPPGTIAETERAAGRVLLAGLARGEILTESRLAPARAGPVAALVPPGLRAFPIATSLPPGSISPGDRVDVLATFSREHARTETVASEVEVLLVMESDQGGGGALDVGASLGGTTVVLLIAPDQVERLAYARAFADLSLSIAPPAPAP